MGTRLMVLGTMDTGLKFHHFLGLPIETPEEQDIGVVSVVFLVPYS